MKGDLPSRPAAPPSSPPADPFQFSEGEEESDSGSDDDVSSPFDSSDEEKKEDEEVHIVAKFKNEGDLHPTPFARTSSLSRVVSQCASPLEFFRLYVTLGLIHSIVEATNKYGSSLFGEN